MASFVCNAGTMVFTGSSIASMCLTNVTVDIAAEAVSFLCMGALGWQTTLAGTKSWTISFDTTLDDTVGVDLDNTLGVSAALTFDTVTGLAYSGTAVITSASVAAPSDGVATVSWTATGSGAIGEA